MAFIFLYRVRASRADMSRFFYPAIYLAYQVEEDLLQVLFDGRVDFQVISQKCPSDRTR
jgi:hypothetical protein